MNRRDDLAAQWTDTLAQRAEAAGKRISEEMTEAARCRQEQSDSNTRKLPRRTTKLRIGHEM